MTAKPIDPVKLFAVLGEDLRLRIWRLIGQQELSVGELTGILSVPQSTVSRHLKTLREAGLVSDRRVGTAVYYQQQVDDVKGLTGQLAEWARKAPMVAADQRRLEEVLAARQSGSRAFFDQLADQWDGLRRQHFGDSFAFQALVGLLPAGWTVADVGCGTGYLLPTLARHFERVIAVDPAQNMLERAQRRVEAARGRVDFRVGSLEQLPIRTGEVDAAIASLVLHHTQEPSLAVRELARVVKPGGTLLIVEIEEHDDQGFVELMGDRWPGLSSRRLAAWMKASGLTVLSPTALDRPPAVGGAGAPSAPPLYALVGRKPAGNDRA